MMLSKCGGVMSPFFCKNVVHHFRPGSESLLQKGDLMVGEDNVRVSVTLPKSLVKDIDIYKGWQSRSLYLAEIIKCYMAEKYNSRMRR